MTGNVYIDSDSREQCRPMNMTKEKKNKKLLFYCLGGTKEYQILFSNLILAYSEADGQACKEGSALMGGMCGMLKFMKTS